MNKKIKEEKEKEKKKEGVVCGRAAGRQEVGVWRGAWGWGDGGCVFGQALSCCCCEVVMKFRRLFVWRRCLLGRVLLLLFC